MIVEFIGCSGSGKTTINKISFETLIKEGFPVHTSFEVILGRIVTQNIHSERLLNILIDIVSFPFFLMGLKRCWHFFIFALNSITAKKDRAITKILLVRSVVRSIGVYSMLNREKNRYQTIIVDEGTLHSAYQILMVGIDMPSLNEIEKFCELAPLPDHIIYIKAPIPDIIERTLKRKDKSRRIRKMDKDEVLKFTVNASSMFEQMAKACSLEERCLQIDNISISESVDKCTINIRNLNR